MAAPPVIGDLLDDALEVFRAFSLDGHRKKQKVRARCFYRLPDDTDGVSLGRTPDAAVAHLEYNHGYCSLNVGRVHTMPYGLQVRSDPKDNLHALIHNVPFIDSPDDEERKAAEVIAGALARTAVLVTNEPYIPVTPGPQPAPRLPEV